jgi:protein-S-isoprenylcysteine O-methyltransferase Ste14
MPSEPTRQNQQRYSNWAGFSFFLCWTGLNVALAAGVFRRTPVVAVLLVPTFAHELITAVAFLLRRPLLRQAQGWTPKASAYLASFLMPAFSFVAGHWQPEWMTISPPPLFMAGLALWVLGAYFGLWSLFCLRKAFSIVPQARTLVTGGPYRLARHPVYAGYLLQYAGVLLSHLTGPCVAVFLAWCLAVMVRIRYEEAVLETAFPQYAVYRRRVGVFMPHFPFFPMAAKQIGFAPHAQRDIFRTTLVARNDKP